MVLADWKIQFLKVADLIHYRIFGHVMGSGTRKMLQHLSWSFLGSTVSLAIFFVLSVVAGRVLGPEEYGKYGLVYALALLFSNFYLFGLDIAAMRFVNTSDKKSQQDGSISVTFYSVIFLLVFFLMIIWLFRYALAGVFKIDIQYFLWAAFLGAVFALRNFGDAVIRGLHLFRFQSFVRLAEVSVVSLVFTLLCLLEPQKSYLLYASAIISGYLCYFVFFLKKGAQYFSRAHYADLKRVIPYAALSFFGGVAGMLLAYSDKILVGKFLGMEVLGVYNAYYTVSVVVATQLVTIFINVFFPAVVRSKEKGVVFQKMKKIFLMSAIPFFIVMSGIMVLALHLFGSAYPIHLSYIVLFSLYSISYVYFILFWWSIASVGVKGVLFTGVHGCLAAFLFIWLFLLTRKFASIELTLLCLIVAMIYAIVVASMSYEKLFQKR